MRPPLAVSIMEMRKQLGTLIKRTFPSHRMKDHLQDIRGKREEVSFERDEGFGVRLGLYF